MLGIVVNLPPAVTNFFANTPLEVLASYALLIVGPIPILGVIVWGFSHLWLEHKQEQYEHALKWVNLEIRVPQTSIQTPKGMENFFANLTGAKSNPTWKEKWMLGKDYAYFSFEIISNGGEISFIIRTQDKFRDLIEADLYAQYPEAQITEVPDYTNLISKKYPNDDQDLFGAETTLAQPQFLPIRTYEDFEHQGEKENRFKDPLLPILEFMGKLQPGEYLWIQILIRPTADDQWVKDGLAYLAKVMGKEEKAPKKSGLDAMLGNLMWLPMGAVEQLTGVALGGKGGEEKKPDDFRMFKLTSAEKIQIDAVAEKVSKIGWRTKIRWVAVGPKGTFRKGMFAAGMKGVFQPFSSPLLNQLSLHPPSIPKNDYFWQEWSMPAKQMQLAKRYAKRTITAGANMAVMNAEELASLFHFPSADARTPVLTAMGARRAEAPGQLPTAPLPIIGKENTLQEPTPDDWKRVYLERRTAAPTPPAHPDAHAPAAADNGSHGEHDSVEHGHDEPPANLPV